MAMPSREQFSANIDSGVLERMREIACQEKLDFDVLVENAFRIYASARRGGGVREEVMAHFRDSLERNRGLVELLADYESKVSNQR